jgi:hypothetical protein
LKNCKPRPRAKIGYRVLVDVVFRNFGQSGVGFLFLGQGSIEQFGGLTEAELAGPGLEAAITRYFVMAAANRPASSAGILLYSFITS